MTDMTQNDSKLVIWLKLTYMTQNDLYTYIHTFIQLHLVSMILHPIISPRLISVLSAHGMTFRY